MVLLTWTDSSLDSGVPNWLLLTKEFRISGPNLLEVVSSGPLSVDSVPSGTLRRFWRTSSRLVWIVNIYKISKPLLVLYFKMNEHIISIYQYYKHNLQ